MSIIRITKQQVQNARRAYEKTLSEDADFRESEEAQEREIQEALAQERKEIDSFITSPSLAAK